ncbi:MAG: BamA/TamA family outer membrane protein [Bacteroidetes bacterium]|nr:BamA/TamA family outer membrane protein [Bacteroidota bacterium]
MLKKNISIIFFFFIYSVFVCSQNSKTLRDTTIIPAIEYEAGGFHEFIFGKHWRDVWVTSIKVKILDLNNFAGGLTPSKKGGGFQTRTLHFTGADGLDYKFRSINKYPAKMLPNDLKETFVDDVLKDQISAANPMAPLVIAPLLKAVGVLQAIPQLVLMPDDKKLGKYRKEFGGLLGMIEVHPDEGDNPGDISFEGADKVIGTYKLFHRLEKKRSEKVDNIEFLKARLMDILLGDWDRHFGQWRWALLDKKKEKLWKPIPRDRDQAFSKFDGLAPSLAEALMPQLVTFEEDFSSIQSLTWNGRFLDRRYLSEITKDQWDSVTIFVINTLTDDIIKDAVKHFPPEVYTIASAELISKLISRRDLLKETSQEYYELINGYVDIFASNKDDFLHINRLNNKQTEVSLYKLDKDTKEKTGKAFYHKIFDNELLEEIRIYLLNGDDKTIVEGDVDDGVLVRVIGGHGKDEFINKSKVHSHFPIIPFPRLENATRFYDSGKHSKFIGEKGTIINEDKIPDPKNDFERYEARQIDRGYEWLIAPIEHVNSDDGVVLGAGLILVKYGFRKKPYDYWMSLTASVATKTGGVNFHYNAFFNSLYRGITLGIEIRSTELALTDFFGFGNQSSLNEAFDADNYYRVEQRAFDFRPSLIFNLADQLKYSLGFSYSNYRTSLKNPTILNSFPYGDYGTGDFKFWGINSSIVFDTRDVKRNPYKGYYINVTGAYFPKGIDNKFNFGKASFDIRHYQTFNTFTDITLAFRTGGEKVWGTYPFFESAFLGGKEKLRGFNRERFAGDASIFAQFEARFYLTKLNIIIPGRFGLHAFTEIGRVFQENIFSDKWHPTYGGGFWLSFIDRAFTTSFSIGKSTEITSFYIRARMGF